MSRRSSEFPSAERMDPLGGDGSGDRDVERRGAGRGRGHGPWGCSSQEMPALRRPHHATSGIQTGPPELKNTEQNKLEKSHEEIVQNSTLSVHAAEFIPKSYSAKQPLQQQQQHSGKHLQKHSVQDRLQVAREIPLQAQMMQQNSGSNYDVSQHYQHGEQVQQYDQSSNIHDYGHFAGNDAFKKKHRPFSFLRAMKHQQQMGYLDDPCLTLMAVMNSLELDPGCYDSIESSVINEMANHSEFLRQTDEMLGMITQMIIRKDNVQYNIARLCASLDTVRPPAEQTRFRQLLYFRCQESINRMRPGDDHEEKKKCCRLILFLAELVTQMEHSTSFGLGNLLIQFILDILKEPSPILIKTICQALKLAGHTLEKDEVESREKMENIMHALTEIITRDNMDTSIINMVHSVKDLRKKNWGRTSSNETPTVEINTEQIDTNQALNEPVFYGPDGKVLTAEESKFLADVVGNATNNELYASLEEAYEEQAQWLSEDEDDIDAAYEEFLKQIPNHTKT